MEVLGAGGEEQQPPTARLDEAVGVRIDEGEVPANKALVTAVVYFMSL